MNNNLKNHDRLDVESQIGHIEYRYYPYDPEKKYIIGSDGSIITSKNGLVHDSHKIEKGYRIESITINGHDIDIATHRIVAQTFLNMPFDAKRKIHVHHIIEGMEYRLNNTVYDIICCPESLHRAIHALYAEREPKGLFQRLDICKQILGIEYFYYPDVWSAMMRDGRI